MIFPSLTIENVLQADDKTRLVASMSFVTNDETITDIEIEPEALSGYLSVFNGGDEDKWYLDWAYETDGTKDVTVRVTTDMGTRSKTYSIDVLTEEIDALFSNDNDLFPYEPTILNYLPVGKNTFIYAHRAAQDKILAYLDEQRIWKQDCERFTKFDIVDKEEFNRWSIFQTLLIIFEGSQVSSNDLYQEKKLEYETEMKTARNRASLRLDVDGDGEVDIINIRTTRMVRR